MPVFPLSSFADLEGALNDFLQHHEFLQTCSSFWGKMTPMFNSPVMTVDAFGEAVNTAKEEGETAVEHMKLILEKTKKGTGQS